MGFLHDSFGVSMICLSDFCGISMRLLWDLKSRGFLWEFYGGSMIVSIGIPMIFL